MIDNASEDRSVDVVQALFPEVRIVRLKNNYGPGVARNIGFQLSTSHFILFIDNDVSLDPDCPERLLDALVKTPGAAVAMPRVVYFADTGTVQYDGAGCHFLGLMSLQNEDQSATSVSDHTREIESAVTACFIVDCNKLDETELFDPAFFIYLEDHDFSIRTRLLGHKILSVPSAMCLHREGTTGLSLRKEKRYTKNRIYHLIKNRWLILLKNYQLKSLLILSPILLAYEIFQFAGMIKKGWVRQWVKAGFWVIRNRKDILQRRKSVQASRTIPDRNILSGGKIPFTTYLSNNASERFLLQVFNKITESYWKRISASI
jgi:GT2 family glycosyltransferase